MFRPHRCRSRPRLPTQTPARRVYLPSSPVPRAFSAAYPGAQPADGANERGMRASGGERDLPVIWFRFKMAHAARRHDTVTSFNQARSAPGASSLRWGLRSRCVSYAKTKRPCFVCLLVGWMDEWQVKCYFASCAYVKYLQSHTVNLSWEQNVLVCVISSCSLVQLCKKCEISCNCVHLKR